MFCKGSEEGEWGGFCLRVWMIDVILIYLYVEEGIDFWELFTFLLWSVVV